MQEGQVDGINEIPVGHTDQEAQNKSDKNADEKVLSLHNDISIFLYKQRQFADLVPTTHSGQISHVPFLQRFLKLELDFLLHR